MTIKSSVYTDIISRDELKEITEKIKTSSATPEEREEHYKYTVEVSYQLRAEAVREAPPDVHYMEDPGFNDIYKRKFRELHTDELEAMVVSHEHGVHIRRPGTIETIRDALVNKILMEEEEE